MNDILSGTYKGNTYRIKVECYPNTPAIKVQLLPVNAGERITMTQNLGQPLPRYQAFLCDGMLEVDSTAFMDYMLHRGLQALRCRCFYRSKPQDCRRFSVPLRRAAPPEQSRLPALRRGLYAAQAEARRAQSPAHGRIRGGCLCQRLRKRSPSSLRWQKAPTRRKPKPRCCRPDV